MNKVEKFIIDTWKDTVIVQRQDEDTLLGLPYPFTCPTVNSTFREMYYWDTYFTNKGLILSGKAAQAKNNVDNMFYLVNKYGFMPNGNRTYYLANSQEPFLSQMVIDIYKYYKDPVWLKSAYDVLCREYEFWMTQRMTESGLNRYYGRFLSESDVERFYKLSEDRLKELDRIYGDKATDKEFIALCMIHDCESGWDCTPRMMGRKILCNSVDCNANLYEYEKNFAFICRELGLDGADEWEAKAEKRAEKMRELMWNGECFNDYDFDRKEKQWLVSSAVFYPLASKLSTPEEAQSVVKLLPKLEYQYGISTCEKSETSIDFQWDYPNGWPCQQYQVVRGLYNYGYSEDAKRVAKKYVDLVERIFEETGHLWEKYNIKEGSVNVKNEYEMPAMMGWSAGTYMAFKKYLDTGILD